MRLNAASAPPFPHLAGGRLLPAPDLLFPVLLKGRLAEAVTRRGLAPEALTLEILHGGCLRTVPVLVRLKPDGFFSLSLRHSHDPIAPQPADPVILRLTATLTDGRSQSAERALTGASLARVPRHILAGGQMVSGVVIAGAPFALNLTFEPAPVSLYGTVIAYRDPTRPVPDALVSAGDLGARTDRFGNFRLGPLPPLPSLVVNITKAGTSANYAFQPDFDRAVNLAAFSLDA